MVIQIQQKHFWCWAAVAVSVDHYLNTASTLTQCELAQMVFPNDNCGCPDSPGEACDFQWYLDDALTKINRLDEVEIGAANILTIQEVRRNFDLGLPVCVWIQWQGGGGHVVAIDAPDVSPSGQQLVHVLDPAFGPWWVDLETFLNSYQGMGKWEATLTVKALRGDQ